MRTLDSRLHLLRFAGLLAAAAVSRVVDVSAAPFLYSPADLVLLVRQTGNASDLVVNLGSVTQFVALPTGTRLSIDRVDKAQVAAAFPSLNGVTWSVAAANRPPAHPDFPLQTLWITAPRVDPATPATPWLRKGSFVQGNAASQIDAIGVNAALASSLLPGGPNNTATGVVLPVASSVPIAPLLGPDGNYVGAFQGKVESPTPDDFDASPGSVARADLFELIPGTTAAGTLNRPGRFLGTFELSPDGSLAFVVPELAPPAPRITAIARSGGTSTVSFTTSSGFVYRLRRSASDGIAGPLATWTVVGSASGTGAAATLEDRSGGDTAFYVVEVAR
ncbi:MAG: hypothetical protein JNL97_17865 [Verrucomicrobiales bacterium]|nr:hypothetical protein [Verrucomicrobiales bacterium]